MQLVILAAGMGSRFGGLKQLEPMDEHNNFIIDYSVFDAIAAGFDKVVFIIRKANERIFRDTIGKRIESKIKVEYVFQENDSVPDDRIPAGRTKPLGTGHAILCCRDVVDDSFMIINADDFYGKGSYATAARFIKDGCSDKVFGCVCYNAGNTLTDNGKVKRGVCEVRDGNVVRIIESSLSAKDEKDILAQPLDGSAEFVTPYSTPVSMNMFILTPAIFSVLEDGFREFLSGWKDPAKDEYLLPDIISKTVADGRAVLRCVTTDEKWIGVTYPEDKPSVVGSIRAKRDAKEYPEDLWA